MIRRETQSIKKSISWSAWKKFLINFVGTFVLCSLVAFAYDLIVQRKSFDEIDYVHIIAFCST